MKCQSSLLASLLIVSGPIVTSHAATDPLAPMSFLLGEWQSSNLAGTDRFRADLGGHVIVRTSQSAPASGTDHIPMQSLTTIYADADGAAHAIYFDNEGHTVRYRATKVSSSMVQFVSEAADPGPRFRLTYEASDNQAIKVMFEIAAPPDSDDFHAVAQATEIRKGN